MDKCVNVYAVTRHFGGPEEGGWFYNHYRVIAFVGDLTDEQATEIQAKLSEIYKDHASGDIYSVLGGVEILAAIEDEPYQSATKERPRYE